MNKIIEKLKKLHQLATRGEPHEAENAKEKLNAICQKYGFSEDDYLENRIERCRIYYKAVWEKRLIVQIAAYNGIKDKYRGSLNKRNYVWFECTIEQSINVQYMFDFYKKSYKKEFVKIQDILFTSFVNKHNLFPTYKKNENIDETNQDESPEYSFKDLILIDSLSNSIEDLTFHKALKK